jgi:hypothetical protein
LKRKYNYIAEPKESGYRGIHFVYENHYPKNAEYDGLLIEIQLRSQLQHLWATAVETVGFFYQEALKYSQGNETWLQILKLVSAIFAYEEKESPHSAQRHLSKGELVLQLKSFEREHGILQQLRLLQIPKMATNIPLLLNAAYLILETSIVDTNVKVRSFLASQQESASLVYRQLEQSPNCKTGKTQVVLVSVDSIIKIGKAYPNYFLNINEFTEKVRTIIQ